jgi:hypothetical protein
MKRKIDKADVAIALERLKSMGVKPTLSAIRITLGNQGSRSTIVKLLKSINDDLTTESKLKQDTLPMPTYLSSADFYRRVDGVKNMGDAISYLVSEKDDPTSIITDLCVVIQRLRLEIKQCHSEVNEIRNLHKNLMTAMQSIINN